MCVKFIFSFFFLFFIILENICTCTSTFDTRTVKENVFKYLDFTEGIDNILFFKIRIIISDSVRRRGPERRTLLLRYRYALSGYD